MYYHFFKKSLERLSRLTRVVFTDKSIFYKGETYLDCLLVLEIFVTPNFVKLVTAVLEIYESCVHGQRNNPNFYKV